MAFRDGKAFARNRAMHDGSEQAEDIEAGSRASTYERWTYRELKNFARGVGIKGRSGMNKAQLIEALRKHHATSVRG